MNAEKVSNTAQRLADIMERKRLKQVDVLDLCKPYCERYGEKINKSHLSQWLSNVNEPSQRKLTILAKVLDVNEPWLMGYDVPEKTKLSFDIPAGTFDPGILESIESKIYNDNYHKLLKGISSLSRDEAAKMYEVARAIFPDKFSEDE